MKKKLVPSLLLFYAMHCQGQQLADTINWRINYKLKWGDFKAVPDNNSTNGAITSATITYIIIPNLKDSTYNIKVFCFFDRAYSWTKFPTNVIALKHEQGHFDITELFARKFRRAIKKMPPSKYSIAMYSDVNKLLYQINKEQDEYHFLYDTETDYCNNVKKQLYWSKKILVEISKLNVYKQ